MLENLRCFVHLQVSRRAVLLQRSLLVEFDLALSFDDPVLHLDILDVLDAYFIKLVKTGHGDFLGNGEGVSILEGGKGGGHVDLIGFVYLFLLFLFQVVLLLRRRTACPV